MLLVGNLAAFLLPCRFVVGRGVTGLAGGVFAEC